MSTDRMVLRKSVPLGWATPLTMRIAAWALVALAAVGAAPAQASDSATATGITDLEKRLELLCEKVDQARKDAHIPGVGLSIVHGDKIILARGFGHRDIEKDLPVTPDTLFAVGSTSKAFTAALICMLEQDGKMSLDEKVKTHVTNFRLKDKEANDKVIIRDLLAHRTGLTRMGMLWAGGTLSNDQILEHVAMAEPYKPFRKAFLYNNVMYLVAGLSVGGASESDWHTQLRDRVLLPLGMKSSNTSIVDMQKSPLAAKGYDWDEVDEKFRDNDMRDLTSAAPAGAINSSIRDMAQWVRFQLARGKIGDKRLLDEKFFDEMHKPHNPMGPDLAYGLGWMLRDWNGKKVVEHGGNIDGFAAEVGLLPEADLGFCFVANVTATPLQQGILNMVWEGLLGDMTEAEAAVAKADDGAKKGGAMSEEELERFVGTYHFAQMQADLTVQTKDGKLAVDVPGQQLFTLKWPNDEGRWVFELTNEIEVSFVVADGAPEAKSMKLYQSGMTFDIPRKAVDNGLPTVEEVLAMRKKAGLLGTPDEDQYTTTVGKAVFVHQGVEGRLTEIRRGTTHFFNEVDLGPVGSIRVATDGEQAFSQTPGEEPEEVFGKTRVGIMHQSPATMLGDWRKYWEKVEVAGKRDFRGTEVIVVKLTDSTGTAHEAYVDPESGRVIGEMRISSQGAIAFPVVTRFEEFQDVDGVQLPTRAVSALPQSGDLVVTIEHVELVADPPADPGIFRLESTLK